MNLQTMELIIKSNFFLLPIETIKESFLCEGLILVSDLISDTNITFLINAIKKYSVKIIVLKSFKEAYILNILLNLLALIDMEITIKIIC